MPLWIKLLIAGVVVFGAFVVVEQLESAAANAASGRRRPQDHVTDAPAAQEAKHVFGSERMSASGSSHRKW